MDRVTLIALLFSALSCVSIDGGAVEASWVVATRDGRRIADCGCTCQPIAKIRLQLVPVAGGADPCADRDACKFACNRQTGATRFDIPPGTYAISLVPVGEDGNDITPGAAGSCQVYASVSPIIRDVLHGRATQIDAIVVETDCAPACGGSDDTKVCAK
jgi:hypothetical protein